ncbi:MAG: SDR family oxidoreductase [Burkholderiales bacterium]
MKGLRDKSVLVTGGGGAIGAAICRRFAEEGARILVADRDSVSAAKVAGEVGGKALVFDISDYAAAQRAVASCGDIHVLVNNAGWDRFQNFLETNPAEWEELIAINLRGPLNMHHLVLPQMAARGAGRVINISSDAARVGSSGESVYSACKGGIVSLTKTLARELARKGVTLNAVCPGPTDTPILRGFLGEGEAGKKVYDALVRAIPQKRVGRPDDVPGIVAFLASDEAAYLTGQVISVSGGLTMAG